MEASESTATATEPQEQEGGEEQAQEAQPTDAPELRSEVEALKERLDAVAPAQPQAASSLADGLAGEPEGEPEGEGFDPFEGYDPYADQNNVLTDPDQFAAYLDEREQRLSSVEQHLIAQAEDQRNSALEALEKEFPDITEPEIMDGIRKQLQPLAMQAGDPELVIDPALVKMAYKSLKADKASASETPAEEAVSQGAVLETGAGPGNQGEDRSYSEEKGDAIVSAGMRKSAFS